jgi:hypothetical protein
MRLSPSMLGGGAGDAAATSALDLLDLLAEGAAIEPVTAISSLRSLLAAGGGGGGGGGDGGAASTTVTGLAESSSRGRAASDS